MGTTLQDLRYALRTLRWNRGFAIVAIMTLALGIGATSAIFSVVDAVLLRPLPYPEPDRLVVVWGSHPQIGLEVASLPDFIDWRAQSESFAGMAAVAEQNFNLTGEGEAERIRGALVSADFFDVMGVNAVLGRTPLAEEDEPGVDRVVVLSHRLWQGRFGGDPSIVGRTIRMQGRTYPVVGIAPLGFEYPSETELWLPLALDASRFGRRGDFLFVVGRLNDGVSLESAQAEMTAIASRLEEEYPGTNARWTAELIPLHEEIVGDIRPVLLAFLGAVGFVLLIVCANVANLLLARAAGRTNEIAIRAALGAGRARLLRQLFTESGVLGLLGGAFGIGLAALGVRGLVALAPEGIPRLDGVAIDVRVLTFTLVIAVGTGLLFGLAPALRISHANLQGSLKEGGGRSAASWQRSRFRRGLVVGEVALAMILLIGAGLLMRSFAELQRVDPGFQPSGVLTFRVALPSASYPNEQVLPFHDRLFERLASLPGVIDAGAISSAPLTGGASYLSFAVRGRAVPAAGEVQDAQVHVSKPGYFETLRIPLIEGRVFTERDRDEGEQVALVSEAMARRYWSGESPLGYHITFGNPQDGSFMTIVGVVGDIHHEGLDSDPYPQVYIPHGQNPSRAMTVVVRTQGDLDALAAAVRSEVRGMDAALPVYELARMTDHLGSAVAQPRFNSTLIMIFALVAVMLAAVGLYGVLAHSVAERAHEIGIRMALGAGQSDVLRHVLGQGGLLVAIGAVIGLGGAAWMSRLLSSLLYGVGPIDPLTYGGVALFLLLVAYAATYIPARRASRLEPMIALRHE